MFLLDKCNKHPTLEKVLMLNGKCYRNFFFDGCTVGMKKLNESCLEVKWEHKNKVNEFCMPIKKTLT